MSEQLLSMKTITKALKTPVAAIALAATLGTASTGHASFYPTGRYGAWDTFALTGSTNRLKICGAEVNGGDKQFMFKFQQTGVYLHIFKTGWVIPVGQQINVVVQIDRAAPFQFTGVGIAVPYAGSGIEVKIPADAVWEATGKNLMSELISLMMNGLQMTIYFPNGTEEPWIVSLSGANPAFHALNNCLTAMLPLSAPTQPYSTTSQPYAPASSQPF